MFLGTYEPKLDDKGRMFLPARFREDMEVESSSLADKSTAFTHSLRRSSRT